MNKLGLTATQLQAWLTVLRGPAVVDTKVSVLSMDGDVLADLSSTVVDGQVLVDRRGRRATRALAMTLADATSSLDFDPNSAADDALWLSHMLQVSASVFVPAVNDWVTCPYFTGPVAALWRDGVNVNVRAHGKEQRAQRDLWAPVTIRRDTPKVDAVKIIMGRTGETLFAFPQSTEMLPRDIGLARGANPWVAAVSIAESMGMQLYYRTDGYCAMRPLTTTTVHTFSTDPGGDISGQPRIKFELGDDFANTIEVLGAQPSPTRPRVRSVRYAPAGHSLSRELLAVGGDLDTGVIVHTHENPHIGSVALATVIGEALLEDQLLSIVQPRFDSVPLYHLEEGDMVAMDTDDHLIPFRLDRFSIPVHTSGRHVMTVGYHDKTTVDRWDS